MHRRIRQHDKRATKHREADTILPQGSGVETKRAENRGAGDFDVEAVFVVDEGEIFDFVDDEAFEGVVEDR